VALGCGKVSLNNPCADPLTQCGDVCVDLTADGENCGACGTTCAADQSCSASKCTCGGGGAMLCGGSCVDTTTDTANCGGCGSACDSGSICTAGACTATCGAPFTSCTDQATSKTYCADTQTDFANCGTCGNACPLLSTCSLGTCVATFGWDPVSQAPATVAAPGTSDVSPAGETSYYLVEDQVLVRYDQATDTYTTLTGPTISVDFWAGMARVGNALWLIAGGEVQKYDIATDTWTAVVATGVHANTEAGTTHDASGKIYTFTSAGEVAIYDTVAGGSVTYVATSILTGISYSEPHVAFDDTSGLLLISPSYGLPNLFSYNPTTGATAALASIPENQMNDAFCGDRAGHLYAAGDSSGTTYLTYDIMNNAWSSLPALPFDEGNCGGCAVVDGFLYFVAGDCSGVSNTARLQLH
jgi:hypothetical protein